MPIIEWQQVQDVFLAVADLPDAVQAERLDELCAGNPALWKEVHSLLSADTGRAGGHAFRRSHRARRASGCVPCCAGDWPRRHGLGVPGVPR